MMIDAAHVQLLLVDVQEKLAAIVADRGRVVRNAAIALRAAAAHAVPVTASEQYPQGLGPTLPELAALLPDAPIAKTEFSCAANEGLGERLLAAGREQVVVCGIETHVCVLQTVLQLRAAGRSVFVVADACGSRSEDSHRLGLERMREAGAGIVTAEMVVFELTRDARAPTFRDMSRLIR